MSTQPLVSIITPSLNQAEFLERTIVSVLEQNYPRIQYILMDGGSTDGSLDIIHRYRERFDHWQSQPDGGQPNALNEALRMCRGDVIAYINSDDWLEPEAVAFAASQFAEDPSLVWLVGGCAYHSQDGIRVRHAAIEPDPSLWITHGLAVPQASSFWSRRLFDTLGFFRTDMQFAFDTEFAVRLLMAGHRPKLADKLLAHRWLHEDCKTLASRGAFGKDVDKIYQLYLPRLSSTEQRRAKALLTRRLAYAAIRERSLLDAASHVIRLGLLSPPLLLELLSNLVGLLAARLQHLLGFGQRDPGA